MHQTVRPAQLALARAEALLVERLEQLAGALAVGEGAAWSAYCEAASALAAIAPATAPGADGRALKTSELAAAFGLTPKVARRKGLRGELPVRPIRLGSGDRSKLRWAAR